MIKFPVHNLEGEKTGTINLPGNIFGIEINSDVIYQVVNAQYANSRFHLAHTKNRGEVRGGGKKPWRQKGTGRARHGSIRSPLWRGWCRRRFLCDFYRGWFLSGWSSFYIFCLGAGCLFLATGYYSAQGCKAQH